MNSNHRSPLSSPARSIYCRELSGEPVMPTVIPANVFSPSIKACETVQSLPRKGRTLVPQLSLQVFRDPADFLLLVPIAVFFPGLSNHIARTGCSDRHKATPRPVAHGSPDPFHQGTNVLLENTQPPVTEEKIFPHRSTPVKPAPGKLKGSKAHPELQEGHSRQPKPASSSSSARLGRVPSSCH